MIKRIILRNILEKILLISILIFLMVVCNGVDIYPTNLVLDS